MIRALIDTNVLLDALLSRSPWDADAAAIFQARFFRRVGLYVTATSLTDVFYIARRLTDRARAWEVVGECLDKLAILSEGGAEIAAAVVGPGNDFEDNLQIVSATLARLDAIVTRDPTGFAGSPVEVLSPAELLARCSSS